MTARRKSSETSSRRTTLKTERISEEGDDFVVTTDRATLLGEYNNQMLKCKYVSNDNSTSFFHFHLITRHFSFF